MSFEIRRAGSVPEFEQLRELLSEYEQGLPPVLRHGSVPSAHELYEAYAAGHDAAFLATDGSRAAGCVAVKRLNHNTGIILRLFVRHRDRGAGTARALTNAALGYLRENRFARVVLDTDKGRLPAAYALYSSLGFSECAAYGAVEHPCPTFMELFLSP